MTGRRGAVMARGPASRRPRGITALAIFFGVAAAVSAGSAISLLEPGSALDDMWRINPRGHEAFQDMGRAAPILLSVLAVACAGVAIGLWRLRRWGYQAAVGLLVVNLIGDVLNVIVGAEPRAAIGVPIVAIILLYLGRAQVRQSFQRR